MKKNILMTLFSAIALFMVACGEKPKPEQSSSYKNDKVLWQQFQSEKAMKNLD